MTAEHDGEPAVHHPTPHQLSDPELITAVRGGDLDSFGPLYTRHVDAARRLARGLARDQSEADDLVAEAFAKLLAAVRAGGGPSIAFRAYLLTTVRNLFYDRRKLDSRVKVIDDFSYHDAGIPFQDTAVEDLERMLVARAFARLPERWQTVLWHTQVEGEPPAAVAPILGLTPNGVAALAYRARERLRQNYLREHVTASPTDECRSIVDRLGAYVRSGLSPRDRAAVDNHLSGCRRCHVLFLELGDVNAGLRGLLAPVILGEAAAVAYLGSSSATGLTAILHPVWSTTKRISRRRSTQAGAAGAVVAAAVALALVLTSGESPPPDPESPPGPGAGPEAAPPGSPDTDPPPPDQPTPPTVPGSTPGAPAGEPATPPGPSPVAEPVTTTVALEPVGALVRDRPGVLAMTVAALDPAGGAGGELAAAAAQPAGETTGTGPLTAEITVPDGVGLRAGEPGDGWSCTDAGGGIRCQRPSMPAGGTTAAYVPVAVSADAAADAPRVRLTGPGIEAASAAAPTGVQSDGLAARIAGIMPATVLTGGNSLLSCPNLDLTCKAARAGKEAYGRTDNDRYLMTGYADPDAPAGAPRHGMVSGASIAVPGEVVWAGLYWAGSGKPPSSPTAYLRPPGYSGYSMVEATTVRRVTSTELGQPAYQASADVTSLVRGTSGGTWWVAVPSGAFAPGFGSFGGWALVVVAEDGGLDRSVAVFDELTALRDEQSFSAAVYGNPGQATIGFIGWEGDRGLTADQLSLGGTPLGGGDRDNLAAGRAAGTPAGWNTLGTDARVVGASFPGGGRRPTLTATTGRDAWLLGPVVVVTPPP